MVLAGASEFDPQYNKDATSRPADNIQIPQVSYIKRCFMNNWPPSREEGDGASRWPADGIQVLKALILLSCNRNRN